MRALTIVAAGVLVCAPAWAQTDLEGSGDPDGFDRFPGSWIVEYSPSTSVRAYEFITGKVARIRREVRIEQSMRVGADLVRVTYRMPDGTRLNDVVAHYESVVDDLGAQIEFNCRGLDCGLSTIWANQVFGVKELAAPDAAQVYVAAVDTAASRLISIYMAQRPNRRVYAHVDVALTEGLQTGLSADDVVEALESKGFAVLGDAAPDDAGSLDEADLQALDELASALGEFEGEVFVVCHVGGSDPERAVTQSQGCAETAAARLKAGGVDAAGFGAGVFAPRDGASASRLELVALGGSR